MSNPSRPSRPEFQVTPETLRWVSTLFRDSLPPWSQTLPVVEAVLEVERCKMNLRNAQAILCDFVNDEEEPPE